MSTNDKLYDDLLEQIGNNGKFQKTFNYLFNFFFIIFATMASFNIVLAMAVPDHWCKVPGRELTNYSVDQWKSITIPFKNESYENCKMHLSNNTISECSFGWEYNTSWYLESIPSKQNWVCGDNLQVSNSFAMNRVGEIVGTFVFGLLGDKFGRKPTFIISIFTLFFGRLLTIFTPNIYFIFLFSLFLGNLSSLAVFQSPLIIGIEISNDDDRTMISLLQCMSWTIGLCILPYIYWFTGHWFSFMLISTLPILPFMFLTRFMIESPRWLASKGHYKKCFVELRKIAKMNGTDLNENQIAKLKHIGEDQNEDTNVFTLFSTWPIAKITLLTMSGWACYMVIYLTLYLNVTNLGGNPFVNFFWQGLAELPGYILGKYLANSLGRRYTKVGSFLITSIGCLVLVLFIKETSLNWLVNMVSVFLKFITSVAFYVISLHTLEIFPTSLRQTGTSICTIVGFVLGLTCPYVVFLGANIDARIPYIILGALAATGAFFGIFLPETLNQKLPETIKEVEEFGKDHTFWSSPKSYKKCKQNDQNL